MCRLPGGQPDCESVARFVPNEGNLVTLQAQLRGRSGECESRLSRANESALKDGFIGGEERRRRHSHDSLYFIFAFAVAAL